MATFGGQSTLGASVETSELEDGAVTNAKVADNAEIALSKIADKETNFYLHALPLPCDDTATGAVFADNLTAKIQAFDLPFDLTVAVISFIASVNSGNETFDIGIYSEDGQTRHIHVTTDAVPASGKVEVAVSPAVSLPRGKYYIAICPNTGGIAGVRTVGMVAEFAPLIQGYELTSKRKNSGALTISAGTLPTTFNPVTGPAELGDSSGVWWPFRLDA